MKLAPRPAAAPVGSGRPVAAARGSRGGTARLVGRRAAGDLLRDRMARTERGDGGTLIVSGPAGVGKSAVLQAAIGIASRGGWQVAHGVASALESPWAYAPVVEAIGALRDSEPAGDRRLETSTGRHRLSAAIREGRLGDDEATRSWLFPAVERLILACAGRAPVLLVVDDVDEADPASVRLLHYVARRAVGHRVLLLLTHRTPTLGGCAQLRDSLLSRDLADTLTLAPLPPAATSRLVSERFPDLAADRVPEVVAASGGLPFAALQLGRFLSGDRSAVPAPRLPDALARTLRHASELDGCFGATQVAVRAGISTTEVVRHLAAGEAAWILERTAAGHRFRHPLLREALATLPVLPVEPTGHRAGRPAVGGWGARRPVCRRRPLSAGDGVWERSHKFASKS